MNFFELNLSQLLSIFIARKKTIILTFLVTVVTSLVISFLWPKSYQATTTLVLNYKGTDPVTGVSLPAQLMPGYMATQINIVKSHRVAAEVVDALKFADNPKALAEFKEATKGMGSIRDWYADLLLKNLDVEPSRDSSMITLSFSGADPQFAAVIANAFAKAYQDTSLQLKTEPSRKASIYLEEQTKALREKLQSAQTRLSTYQQDHGITSGLAQYDTESTKLNELTAQLVGAQSAAIDANSRQTSARGNASISPDVAANPLVQSLKVGISQAESKLADIVQRLGINHPQYLSAKAELDNLKSELRLAVRNAANHVGGTAAILRQREAKLRAKVAEQKTKVLALNRTRDQLSFLEKDVQSAQLALEAINQRFTQTNLEGKGNQTDVVVLNPAIPPLRHATPKRKVNLILGILFGTIFGVAFALLAEMFDRRVRSSDDIQEGAQIPILGLLVSDTKKRSRRKKVPLLRLSREANTNS